MQNSNIIKMAEIFATQKTKSNQDELYYMKEDDFDFIFNDGRSILSRVLREYIEKGYSDSVEKVEIIEGLVSNFKSCIADRDQSRLITIKSVLNSLTNRELIDLLVEKNIDISNAYQNVFKDKLSDMEFVVELLKVSEFGARHDTLLISNFKSFFYQDSEKLRTLISGNPEVYDKLAKIGNKPNFPIDFIKKLVSIHGAKYFVSRLSNELKNDSEFMEHAIIESPENLFRGQSSEYRERITKNAYALFGIHDDNIFEIYGMDYILNHTKDRFIDYGEYLKHQSMPSFMVNIKDKLLTRQEQYLLLLRGKLPESCDREFNFNRRVDFKGLLRQNFIAIKCPFNEELINNIFERYKTMLNNHNYKNDLTRMMVLANNIASSYKRGTVDELQFLDELDDGQLSCNVDMSILTKEVISKIGIDNIAKLAYYPNSLYILSQIIKSNLVDMYVYLIRNIPKSNDPVTDYNALLYSVFMHSDVIKDLYAKKQLNTSTIEILKNITKNNRILPISNANDVINYSSNLNKFCDIEIKNCKDVNYAKELIFAKFLKTSRLNAQDLIMKYKAGLKEKNSGFYRLLELLEVVDSLNNIEDIKMAYNKLKSLKMFSKLNIEELESKIKNDIVSENYVSLESLKVGINHPIQKKVQDYARRKGVEAFMLDPNSKFQMLVHVFGAYGSTPGGSNLFEQWNTASRANYSGICTTLISEKTMQTALAAGGPDSVIFGFKNNLPSEDILMCGPYDIYSKTNKLENYAYRQQVFLDSDNLPDYMRSPIHRYNEVVISRVSNSQKRQPDYIVHFTNQQSSSDSFDKSLDVAKQFGIPVMVISESDFLKSVVDKWQAKYIQFINNPTLELAKNIYVEHQTISHGYMKIKGVEVSMKDIIDVIRDINDKLSPADKEKFRQFILKEKEKQESKKYYEDQRETVDEKQESISLKTYIDLRKEHSMKETIQIMKIMEAKQKIENTLLEETEAKRR